MPPRPRSPRRRLTFLWLALAVITALAGFAVHHLYHSLRRELAAQSQFASANARAEALRDLETLADATRHETFTTLIGFHLDGLGSQLRRWDEARPEIIATFQWDKTRGLTFVSALENPPALATAPESLWPALRAWRQHNPGALAQYSHAPDAWVTEAHATLNNPRFATGLGYQNENLEQLAYEKKLIDPWVGVAADPARPQAPWIFWYQPGPDTPVRGCLLDPRPLIARSEERLRDHTLATLRLSPEPGLDFLPGHSLLVAPGELFASKQTTALLAALALALLLALVLLAALTLTHFTRRATLEAERKTSFVAQVSHELRTPLTSIQMFADMLHGPQLDETKRQKYAGHISRETSRLRGMVERLLSFSSLQQNKFRPALEDFELHALVHETLDETSALLAQAGLFPELRRPAAPLRLHTDRAALKQALLNLLENAAKYAPNTGALILAAETSAHEIHLRVSDEGPGISPALRNTLFDPFVQGDQTLVGKKPGLGLGLSIARGQLRACGGDLVLVPTAQGATFEIRLPR